MAALNTDPVTAAFGLPHGSTQAVRCCVREPSIAIHTVHNTHGTPYMACGVVTRHDANGELRFRQALLAMQTVSVGVLVDAAGERLGVLRKSFRTGAFAYVAAFDASNEAATPEPITFSELKPLTQRFESVLFEVHSALRDIDGLHGPDALDEICKLIAAKIHDEEQTASTGQLTFQRGAYGNAEACAAEIRQLYLRTGACGEILLSSQAIVRAVELLQAYAFHATPMDIKGRAFQNVLIPQVRAGMGQFFTPKEIIDFVVAIVGPTRRDRVIDPFCGSGHFLTSAQEFIRREQVAEDIALRRDDANKHLHGIEKCERMARVAMTDMRLHGDDRGNILCADSLLPFANYPDIKPESFDIVMTNPPFGVDFTTEALTHLGPFELAAERRTSLSLEIVAVERCLQLLRSGGKLAIVLPDSVLSNRTTAHARTWLRGRAKLRAVLSLPLATFAPFGANIKTSVLVLRKRAASETSTEQEAVFMAEIDDVGFDAAGRSTGNNELPTVAARFRAFIAREGW